MTTSTGETVTDEVPESANTSTTIGDATPSIPADSELPFLMDMQGGPPEIRPLFSLSDTDREGE